MLNVLVFVAGAIVGIFFYRNNLGLVGKIADKIDDIVEYIKEKLK